MHWIDTVTGLWVRWIGLVYAACVALAAVTVIMVVANDMLASRNQTLQADVNQRQQFINQSAQLARVSEMLIRTLASASVNAKDDKLREILTQQGISMTVVPNAAPAAPASGDQKPK
ncbi:MAG TPA: hypothetical protein VN802_20105 [Stellaceae bacterium]|nr:hypothetical protein [Stellaceae bacterium]